MRSSFCVALLAAVSLTACSEAGVVSKLVSSVAPSSLPMPWPPVAGESYPDLELLDHRGQSVRLSDFEGKVLLIEPIGMT